MCLCSVTPIYQEPVLYGSLVITVQELLPILKHHSSYGGFLFISEKLFV